MTRLNWASRQNPGEFDTTAPEVVSMEFDYRHAGGANPWPEKHCGIKFGPALIKRAWASGLLVFAEVEGFPYPMAAKEARWTKNHVLEIVTLEGLALPTRLFTRKTARGVTVGGLLIESES
jgi:hypothetical protein